jgi:hypothetical protein
MLALLLPAICQAQTDSAKTASAAIDRSNAETEKKAAE